MARTSNGDRAGFVWVDQSRSGFTGVVQAYILSIYVSESQRGEGVGRGLLTRAEAWVREHNLTSIGLNVAAHNIGAIALYESLGYQEETLSVYAVSF